MAQIDQSFQLPINLNRLEIRNAVLQNLATPPTALTGLFYYNTVQDTPGHFNGSGVFVPWDATKATNIPNGALTNSSVTLGTSNVVLGATITAIAGLVSLTATTITGALIGNATTATKLATARSINVSGVTGTAVSFDGSADISIAITAIPTTLLSGVLAATNAPALTGDVTSTAGTGDTVIAPGVVTLTKLANLAASSLIGNATGSAAAPTPITLGSSLAFSAGVLNVATGGISNAQLANSIITLGTTVLTLGATVTDVTGLNSLAATTLTGALVGNASTATKLATARTISLTGGVTGTATAFDGSGNIAIPVTAVATSALVGTITSSYISDLSTVVQAYTLDKFAAPVASVSMGNQLITNLSPGVSGTDAVNLNQLNAKVSAGSAGLTPHNAVRLATTANIATLSGLLIIDGVQTAAGDRVLVKNQTDGTQNGIYVVASGAWALATDSTQGNMVTGSMMLVTEGTLYTGSQWWLTTPAPITIGTTSLTYSEYGLNTGISYTNGLTQTGAVVSVKPDVGITVSAAGVAVDTSVVVRKVTATIGDGSSTSFAITHALNTTAVTVSVINISNGNIEFVGISVTSATVVTISFANAPAAASYRVVIHG